MDDPLEITRAHRESELDQKRQEWERRRTTPEYVKASTDLTRIRDEFIRTLRVCWFAATRIPEYVDRSVVLRSTDDMLECAVIQHIAVEHTARNTAQRELRYLLELAVQALFVDQQMPRSPFDHRLAFLERKVTTHGLTPELDELQLHMFDGSARKAFVTDMGRAYGRASKYVHPSVEQIRERSEAAASGLPLGFDSADVLQSLAQRIFEVYGLVLVLVLHSLGPTAAGDVMESAFGEDEDWLFRQHRHIARMDEYFDYKAERCHRLELLRKWRGRSFAQ